MSRFFIVSLAVLVFAFWMVGVATAIPTPLVQYTFDEASSGNTNAINQGSLGSAGDGVFSGNATRTASTPGSFSTAAMDSPGLAGDHVATAGDLDGVDGLSTITISTWANIQSPATAYDRLTSDNGDGSNGWSIFIAGSSTNYLAFNVDAGTSSIWDAASTEGIDMNLNWVYTAITWDQSAAELKYYTGTEAGAVTQLGTTIDTTGWGVPSDNTGPLLLGAGYVDLDRNPTILMDDYRIYGSVLGLSELETIRQSNLVPEPSAIVIFMTGLLGLLCYAWRKRK